MTVIWSGVTEEGAVVPVQVDETGKVIATAAVPGGDYVKKTGDNMTGDLTLGEDPNITLTAAGGSIAANGGIRSVGDAYLGNAEGVLINGGPDRDFFGSIDVCREGTDEYVWKGWLKGNNQLTSSISAGGSITAAGNIIAGENGVSSATEYFRWRPLGGITLNNPDGSAVVFQTYDGVSPFFTSTILANGSATYAGGKCGFTAGGELFFTSRNARYKLVVQGDLVVAEPYTREMELKEKAEQFIADKRETKPSDPSDSQSGVSMDIDNSSPKQD